jgi:hypothetical protein
MRLQLHESQRQPRLLNLPRAVIDLEPEIVIEFEQIAPVEPLLPPRVERELLAEAKE